MNNYKCDVIADLLPLYVDDVCSEESRHMVEEHLELCECCRKLYEDYKSEISIPQEQDVKFIKEVKKKIRIEKIVIVFIITIVVMGLASILGIFMLGQTEMNKELAISDVNISEDANGTIWLERSGCAVDANHIFLNMYSDDGTAVVEYEGIKQPIEEEKHIVVKILILESRAMKISHKVIGVNSSIKSEKSKLINIKKNANIDKIVIVTGKDKMEHVLWERKE